MTTIAAAAITGAALVLTACGSPEIVSGPSTTAPAATQPPVSVGTAPASPAPDVGVDAGRAAWEKLDATIAAGDTATAATLTAPGSAAAIYADTAAALTFARPGTNTRTTANSDPVVLGGPITVDPAGLITDLTRNGISLSQSIAGPAGEVLVANSQTVEYGDFTGETTATVMGTGGSTANFRRFLRSRTTPTPMCRCPAPALCPAGVSST